MNQCIETISKKYLCRESVIAELYNLFGYAKEPYPDAVYFHGPTSCGKSVILEAFLPFTKSKHVTINCLEFCSPSNVYETIINKFHDHELSVENNYQPYRSLNLSDFIEELADMDPSVSYIIVFEYAEKLRDVDLNILPVLMRLQEFTQQTICSIFVGTVPWENFIPKTGLSEIIKVSCPDYTKEEAHKILVHGSEEIQLFTSERISESKLTPQEQDNRIEIVAALHDDFFDSYVSLFLSVFFKVCRNLEELQRIARDCFPLYVQPIFEGVSQNDAPNLWRNISKTFKNALESIHTRIDQTEMKTTEDVSSVKVAAKNIDLPMYGKFLLIAAFLASHNPSKEDKRLFMKHHGKKRKSAKSVIAKSKVSEKMQTQLGPKSFSIDRLLAIFYAILDDKISLTCNLLAQIRSLVHLQYLSFTSGESNVMEGSARLQCNLRLEYALELGKLVGFNVRQYLCDFF